MGHMSNRTTKSWAAVTHILKNKKEEQPNKDTTFESELDWVSKPVYTMLWKSTAKCCSIVKHCNYCGIILGTTCHPHTKQHICVLGRFGECHSQTLSSPSGTDRNLGKLPASSCLCVWSQSLVPPAVGSGARVCWSKCFMSFTLNEES